MGVKYFVGGRETPKDTMSWVRIAHETGFTPQTAKQCRSMEYDMCIQIPPHILWPFLKKLTFSEATDKGGMPKLRQHFARVKVGNRYKVTSDGAGIRPSATTQTQVCFLRWHFSYGNQSC